MIREKKSGSTIVEPDRKTFYCTEFAMDGVNTGEAPSVGLRSLAPCGGSFILANNMDCATRNADSSAQKRKSSFRSARRKLVPFSNKLTVGCQKALWFRIVRTLYGPFKLRRAALHSHGSSNRSAPRPGRQGLADPS